MNAYEKITEQVVNLLKEGLAPWRKPWNGPSSQPTSMSTGKPYNGFLNLFTLNCVAISKGFDSPYWGTFNVIKKAGGRLKKGQTGTPVSFWKQVEIDEVNEDTGEKETIPFLRYYIVFNLDQTEGLEDSKFSSPKGRSLTASQRIQTAEDIRDGYFKSVGAPGLKITKGDRAYFSPGKDKVFIPSMAYFDSPEEWYSTLFHEMGHSTGTEKRLNRACLREVAMFGDHNYSKEELVAEFTACFLSSEAGISSTIENSASYIQNWIKRLENDPKLIVHAASAGTKASNYILERAEWAEKLEELDGQEETKERQLELAF